MQTKDIDMNRIITLYTQAKMLVVFFVLCTLGNSCIQDEPLNPEADILAFSLPGDIALSKATFNQSTISINVRPDADLTHITPIIEITEGATIEPAADTPQNFTKPVIYTVTAADRIHQRIYTVQLITSSIYEYTFEYWKQLDKNYAYLTPVEYDADHQELKPWDSSNKGIAIYQQYPNADDYPVHPTSTRMEGKLAAEMVTKKGPGSILGILNIPVVAGSLFTGVLNPLNALKDPLLATQFGQPFSEKPLRMRGHYMYKAGQGDYIDRLGNAQPGLKDSCAIYSVFFRTDKNLEMLDGTNILTDPNIVAIAMLPPENRAGTEGDDFVAFDIPFEYKNNVEVDFEKNKYKLVIVFSSSFYGDRYEGTPGSCLIVDDVEIITEEN